MAVSVIPFVIVQFPNMLSSDSGRNLAVLIGLIFSVTLLISYCLYQVIGYLAESALTIILANTNNLLLYTVSLVYVTELSSDFQVFQPWVQKRRLDYIKHRHVMSGILKHLKKHALGRLCTEEGRPNVEVLSK